MTPNELSQIHSAAFTMSRPWSAQEFEDLLRNKHTHLFTCPQGFALVQVIAGEAELLTIAVHPDAQGKGAGGTLMSKWMSSVDADEAFLEVAADNARRQTSLRSYMDSQKSHAVLPIMPEI